DGDGSLLGNDSDDQNQTYALDGRWGIGDNGLVSAWAAKTETPGLTGRDDAFGVSHDFNNADWSTSLGYAQVGADFNPEVGFLSRSAYRKVTGRILRRIRPKDLWNLFEIRPHISANGFWDFDGFQETGFVHIDSHWEFETGTEIHTGMNITKSGVKSPFDIIPGTTIQPGTYDHNEAMLRLIGDQSKPFNFSMLAIIGGRFGGDRLTLQPAINYRIGDKFSSELSYNYNDFDLPVPNGKFTANLMRLRLSYSFTPQVLLQLLTQYNEVSDTVSNNLRFSWLRSANSGLFLVYNEVDDQGLGALPRGREFIVKYSHIFDVLN
ncbi:MAG: carbohydrate binding family 9 domain-containing protein, partial [Woeseiales bacterium]